MTVPTRERVRRLLATPPHHRTRPLDINYVTTALLAHALGVTDTPGVSDVSFDATYRPGRADHAAFPEEAQHVPLLLARIASLRAEGRVDEANALLGPEPEPAPEPEPEPEPDAPQPDPDGDPDAPLGADAEVVQPTAGDQGNADPTPLPHDFPMRDALTDHDLDTIGAVDGASDDDLLAIPGIGAAKVSLIRAAIAAAGE